MLTLSHPAFWQTNPYLQASGAVQLEHGIILELHPGTGTANLNPTNDENSWVFVDSETFLSFPWAPVLGHVSGV